MEKNYSAEMALVIRSFLDENDWTYNFNNQLGVFKFEVWLNDLQSILRYTIDVRRSAYTVIASYEIAGLTILSDRWREVTNFVNLVNEDLSVGTFFLDEKSGSVCYKLSHDPGRQELLMEDVKRKLYYAASKVKYYSSGFEQVLNQTTANEALNDCRQKLVNHICYNLINKKQ